MATARDMGVADVSFSASNDMTAKQYTVVIPSPTAGYINAATSGCLYGVLGVIQNSPSAGQEARVRLFGLTKVYGEMNGTCNLAYGGYVLAASTGRVEPIGSTGCPAVGRWLSAAVTSGDVVGEVYLFPTAACTVSAC